MQGPNGRAAPAGRALDITVSSSSFRASRRCKCGFRRHGRTDPFPEQVPFLEWQNSDFGNGLGADASCQDCHLPPLEGQASIRSWIHLQAVDANGQMLFESGAPLADGRIAGNDADLDLAAFEPHYERITAPDQVQIYDRDFIGGSDAISYDIPVESAAWPVTIHARLLFQPVAPSFVQDLGLGCGQYVHRFLSYHAAALRSPDLVSEVETRFAGP